MKRNLPWLIGGLLLLSLAACNLAEVTPIPTQAPPTGVVPSLTPSQASLPTVLVTEPVTVPVRQNNVQNLQIVQRAAVRNILDIVWSQDSSTLAVITQIATRMATRFLALACLDATNLN